MVQPAPTADDIVNRFGYHRATFPAQYDPKTNYPPLLSLIGATTADGVEATAPLHAAVRKIFIEGAQALIEIVPPGREQALMLTALQEASMWANAGVAMQSPLVIEE